MCQESYTKDWKGYIAHLRQEQIALIPLHISLSRMRNNCGPEHSIRSRYCELYEARYKPLIPVRHVRVRTKTAHLI